MSQPPSDPQACPQPAAGTSGTQLDELADQYPLAADDPVKIGDYWLDARLTATAAGMGFTAHEDGGDAVMLLLLSAGAAADPAARSRFSGEINAMHIDTVVARGGEGQAEGRTGIRFKDESDDPVMADHAPLAPWVAIAFDGTVRAVREAERVLHAVDLELTPPLGTPSGPDYRLHWSDKTAHGTTRLWPLPWPGRTDRAGWITILVSWLLMLLLAAIAILLAILVFQNQPPVAPPPLIPQDGSGSGSPQSVSPSSSGSDSGSPTESTGNQPPTTHSASMRQPSGTESGPGSPSPNRKL